MRQKWAEAVITQFLEGRITRQNFIIRDWDFVLNLDGSVENLANLLHASLAPPSSSATKSTWKVYSARFRLPDSILHRLRSDEERTDRQESFALGCILYELFTSKRVFHSWDDGEFDERIQVRYTAGHFPEDVWGLPMATAILACWCPRFNQTLASRHLGRFAFYSY